MDKNSFNIFAVVVILLFVISVVLVVVIASYMCPSSPQYFIVELRPKTPEITNAYGGGLFVLYNNELKYYVNGTNVPIDTVANITIGATGVIATTLYSRILNIEPPAMESIGVWSSTNYTNIPFNSDMINYLNNGQLYVNMGILQGKIQNW